MNFWFDRNVPIKLAEVIAVYDTRHRILHQDDDSRFKPKTPDIEWMRVLADDEVTWHIITNDKRILRNRAERAVLRECNLSFVFFDKSWSNASFHDRAWKLLRIWPEIVREVELAKAPTVFKLGVRALKLEKQGLTKSL